MILDKNETLEEIIVKTLVSNSYITASEIRKKISKSNKLYSEQAIFKSLKKLQEKAVITKFKSKYGLNMSWATNLISLSESIEQEYFKTSSLKHCLPYEQGKTTWEFSSLFRMRNFWTHMVLVLLKNSSSKTLLSWNPHPWYYHTQTEQQQRMLNSIKLSGAKVYRIIGGSYYLDKFPVRYWKESTKYSFSLSPFEHQRKLYFSCVDNNILSIKLTPTMARRIDDYFENIKNQKEFNTADFLELLNVKTRIIVELNSNVKKGEKVRGAFSKHFAEEVLKLHSFEK